MTIRHFTFISLVAVITIVGCKSSRQVRDPEYADVVFAVQQSWSAPDPVPAAVNPIIPPLEGPHPVEDYIRFALVQNPEIHAARKRMEALAYQVPVAASLQDPMLTVTAQPAPVQTAAGKQQVTLAGQQKFPWFGKLQTRADAAEARTNAARAKLAAAELSVAANVKRAYYELYYIQQAISVTEAERSLLVEIRDVAIARYEAGRAPQQDVLRADLQISNVDDNLIRLRQQLASGQARLARLLHVSPQTNALALEQLPPVNAPRDLVRLQHLAVAARPELHAQLAELSADRSEVELARLDYRPDVTLGFSWISVADAGLSPVANGADSLLLSAGVNLPIYRKRLDSALRSAEAQAVSAAREYDSLRDMTLEEVTDLFAQVQSQQQLLTLFQRDILPTAQQTLEVSLQAYNVGEIDFLQLIDNWTLLLRYELSYRRLEASLRQTLAELERVIGGMAALPINSPIETVPAAQGKLEALPPVD